MSTHSTADAPVIVGIGGTTRPGSSANRLLHLGLDLAAAQGAKTQTFDGAYLVRLPLYDPELRQRSAEQSALLDAVRSADGILLLSPGYHNGISALVKNALDLLEDLSGAENPYLEGKAVGCLATAFGGQAGGMTLSSMRSIVHALRGWPTPLGLSLVTQDGMFDAAGRLADGKCQNQLETLIGQIMDFAKQSALFRADQQGLKRSA